MVFFFNRFKLKTVSLFNTVSNMKFHCLPHMIFKVALVSLRFVGTPHQVQEHLFGWFVMSVERMATALVVVVDLCWPKPLVELCH